MSDLDHISRSLDAERAALARSMHQLTGTLRPDAVTQDAAQVARDLGAEAARKGWGAVKDNPTGGALLALGLGLLATGKPRLGRSDPAPAPVAFTTQRETSPAPKSANLLHDKPLVASAVALGIGVLAGALIPRKPRPVASEPAPAERPLHFARADERQDLSA